MYSPTPTGGSLMFDPQLFRNRNAISKFIKSTTRNLWAYPSLLQPPPLAPNCPKPSLSAFESPCCPDMAQSELNIQRLQLNMGFLQWMELFQRDQPKNECIPSQYLLSLFLFSVFYEMLSVILLLWKSNRIRSSVLWNKTECVNRLSRLRSGSMSTFCKLG